jgi:ribonucleoside-diphosphate reductase alpha chain
MHVIKRNGKKETIKFDKVTARIEKLLSYSLSSGKRHRCCQKVIEGIYDGVPTTELDNLAAETAASLATIIPTMLFSIEDAASNLHKNTIKSFSETMKKLYLYVDKKNGKITLLADDVWQVIEDNAEVLEALLYTTATLI